MFKFSTNTILNSIVAGAYHEVYQDTDHDLVHIHHLGKFKKGCVTKIYKRASKAGTPGSAVITCATSNVPSKGTTQTAAGIYRLMLYVKLSGNNDSNYANTNVFKGKPFAFEFEVKGASVAAADIAKAAEETVARLNSRFAEDKVFEVKASGANLTITAVGPDAAYHNITTCVLQKFDATVDSALVGGEYVDVVEGTATACENPFGTYGQLIKDLRLPTLENTLWSGINADDKPSLGATYTQYIIYMAVDRGVMGGDAVGEVVKSVTAHSIWVNDNITNFETLLTGVGLPAPVDYHSDYTTALGDATDPSDDDKTYKADGPVDVIE